MEPAPEGLAPAALGNSTAPLCLLGMVFILFLNLPVLQLRLQKRDGTDVNFALQGTKSTELTGKL